MMLTERLKEETQSNHQSLEKKLIGKMRAMRSETDYIAMLVTFYSYFGGLEKLIKLHLDQTRLPDYQQRRKAGALAADLIDLDAVVPPFANESKLPVIANHQDALGALYVIEGSTLGGRIITKMINQQLPLMAGRGLTFFTGYGDDTITMWEQFKSSVNRAENLPGDGMIEAANATFLKFGECFD